MRQLLLPLLRQGLQVQKGRLWYFYRPSRHIMSFRRRLYSSIAIDKDEQLVQKDCLINQHGVTVVFVDLDDNNIEATVPVGTTILEAAHQNGIGIEGACDGCMACSTCHVILDDEVYESLPEPAEEELDMLDLAPGVTNTSRLGCQIKLDSSHEGIKIHLPKLTRNFYVDGHVPKPH